MLVGQSARHEQVGSSTSMRKSVVAARRAPVMRAGTIEDWRGGNTRKSKGQKRGNGLRDGR